MSGDQDTVTVGDAAGASRRPSFVYRWLAAPLCTLVGIGVIWTMAVEGPWWFAIAGSLMIATSIAYIARPLDHRLGWMLIAWGGSMTVRWLAAGAPVSFDGPRAAGSNVGVLIGALILIAGIRKVSRRDPV